MFKSLLQKYQFLIFSGAWLSYAITYFLRKPLGVIKPALEIHQGFSKAQLGWLDVALIGSYALSQVTTSKLADRVGPRLTITLCLTVAGTAMCTFGFWDSYIVIFLLMVINGTMQGPCWPSCCKIVCAWFPDSQVNTVIGFLATSAFLGGAAGTAAAVWIQFYYSYKLVHLPSAVASVGLALLVFRFLHFPQTWNIVVPGKDSNNEKTSTTVEGNEQKSFMALLKIPIVFEITMTVLFIKVVRYCMFMWLPMYLTYQLNYSIAEAGLFSTLFDIGGSLGSPIIGIILDRYFASNGLLGAWSFVTLSSISLISFAITAQWGFAYNAIFIFITGATNCGVDALLAGSFSMKIGEANGLRSGAAVTGLVNGVGTFGAVCEGPIVAFIVERWGWNMAFTFMIVLSALASLMVFKGIRIQSRLDRAASLQQSDKEALLA